MADQADIYQELISRGFNPAQAAALTGNIEQESSFNPNSTNEASGAYGLLNWRGPRLQALQQYASSTGRDVSDPNAQLDFLTQEMLGPEAPNAKAFLSSNDVAAANAALKPYIRYGANESGNRLQYAQAAAVSGMAGQPSSRGTSPMAKAAPSDDLLTKYLGGGSNTPSAAPTAPTADDALLAKYLGNSTVATPPAGLVPGSKAYADWAVQQAKAGNALPQVSPTPPAAAPASTTETTGNATLDQIAAPLAAGFTAAANSVPIVGPTLLKGIEGAKAAVYGVPQSQIAADDAARQQANPVASGVGTVIGTVAPFALAPESALLGTSADATLPIVGNLGARIAMGGASSAGIEGADTLARGGSVDQARNNALLAGGLGAAAPAVFKGLGAAYQAFKGPSAAKTLTNALTDDQIAPGQVSNLLTQLGPNATVADLGPNTQQLAGSLASLPGQPKTIVMNNLLTRAQGAGDRLQGAVDANLGAGAPIQQQIDNLSAAQSAAAKPLYDAVRDVRVTPTPALVDLMQRPAVKAALDKAATLAANDGYSANGLTVGLVDYAKRALNDSADVALRAGNGNDARQATSLANQLTSAVDAQVPGYAAARDAFAGPAKVKDAIEFGQSVFSNSTTPEQLQAKLAGMSTSERDGLLLGTQSAVQQAIGNAKNDAQAIKTMFASSNAQQKLAMVIGPDAAKAISDAIAQEGTFAGTKNVAMGNSLTAARLASQKAVSPATAAIPNSTKDITILGLIGSIFGGARKALTGAYRNAQNVKLANMLTTPAGSAAQAALTATPNRLLAPATVPLLAQNLPVNQNSLIGQMIPHAPVNMLQIPYNPEYAAAGQ